jgi:mycofactocin precursor
VAWRLHPGGATARSTTTLRVMENENIVEASTDASIDDGDIEEELLIEEISIDGMCGVY